MREVLQIGLRAGGHGRLAVSDVANSERSPAMTVAQAKLSVAAAKELLKGDPDGLREVVRAVLQEVLEAEMTDALGAAKGERTPAGWATARATTAGR